MYLLFLMPSASFDQLTRLYEMESAFASWTFTTIWEAILDFDHLLLFLSLIRFFWHSSSVLPVLPGRLKLMNTCTILQTNVARCTPRCFIRATASNFYPWKDEKRIFLSPSLLVRKSARWIRVRALAKERSLKSSNSKVESSIEMNFSLNSTLESDTTIY